MLRYSLGKGFSPIAPLMVIFLIISVIVFWMTNASYTGGYVNQIARESEIDAASWRIENIKNYCAESLVYSGYQSAFDAAKVGLSKNAGGIGVTARPWVCNKDVSPNYEQTSLVLENLAKNYLNLYLDSFPTEIPFTVKVSDFASTDIANLEPNIDAGEHDKNMSFSASGSSIIIVGKTLFINSENDVSALISNIRFWYLYRNLAAWTSRTETSGFTKMVCDAASTCQDCSVRDSVIENARVSLENMFDENVTCRVLAKSCYQDSEHPACKNEPNACFSWQPPQSWLGSPEDCNPTTETGYGQCLENEFECVSCDNCGEIKTNMISPRKENRLAIKAELECEDGYYRIPTDLGFKNVTFRIYLVSSLRNPNGCANKPDSCENNPCPDSCSAGPSPIPNPSPSPSPTPTQPTPEPTETPTPIPSPTPTPTSINIPR